MTLRMEQFAKFRVKVTMSYFHFPGKTDDKSNKTFFIVL